MRCLKIALLLVLVIVYVMVATHNPPAWFKALGYNQILDAYGKITAGYAPLNWVHDPGLRSFGTGQTSSAHALIPSEDQDHHSRIVSALQTDPLALIECSAVDAWHTTTQGRAALSLIRDKAYRVVVFDGGHHLPTLGLQPDILLIPALNDTAVHTYMRDGISLQTLQQLLEKIDSPSVAVAVPRWLVVKRPASLQTITERIIRQSDYRSDEWDTALDPCTSPGMSWYNGYILAYINRANLEDPGDYADQLRALDPEIKEVFMAFNYNDIDQDEATVWADQVGAQLGTAVTIVNRPVKVSDLLLGR